MTGFPERWGDSAREAVMADGWVVKVTLKQLGGGETEQFYLAHIEDRSAAEEAVKQHVQAIGDTKVEAQATVAHGMPSK